mmetsp:Transcript_45871/g.143533  ORF Transcript_45871/g.143533 Transcript_45871/m.143533 type:complete len:628 (-) Transcript_45871:61-1944(-)
MASGTMTMRRVAEGLFFFVLGAYFSGMYHIHYGASANGRCHCDCDPRMPPGHAQVALRRATPDCPACNIPRCPDCPECPVFPGCSGEVAAAVAAARREVPKCPEAPAARPVTGDVDAMLHNTEWQRVMNVPRIATQLRVNPYIVAVGDRENGGKSPENALLFYPNGRGALKATFNPNNATIDEMLEPCEEVNLVVAPVVPGRCLLLAPTDRVKTVSYHIMRHMRKTKLKAIQDDPKTMKRIPDKDYEGPGHGSPEHKFEQIGRFAGIEEYGQISGRMTISKSAQERSDEHLTRVFAGMKDMEASLAPVLASATAHITSREVNYYSPEVLRRLKNRSYANDKIGAPVITMAVNEGAIHLLANFICSAKANNIDIRNLVVLVSHDHLVPVVEGMGAYAFYHKSMGDYPEDGHKVFGDATFSKMMFLKVLAAYLPLRLGYDVLFQDADHVWLREPWPYFRDDLNIDAYFMDDGSRDSRFAPYFANSGFYYWRYNPPMFHLAKNIFKNAEILGATRSHQVVVNQALIEANSLYGVNVEVVPKHLFVTGQQFHRNKTFMNEIKEGLAEPYLFHMCWTKNGTFKVHYFREMNMWYMNDDVMDYDGGNIVRDLRTTAKPDNAVAWQDVCVAGHH